MSDYPASYHMRRIRRWDAAADPEGLMRYVRVLWRGGCAAFDGRRLELHPGDSPANEDILRALKENEVFWLLYWEASGPGGHHAFQIALDPSASTGGPYGEEEEEEDACSVLSVRWEGSMLPRPSAG